MSGSSPKPTVVQQQKATEAPPQFVQDAQKKVIQGYQGLYDQGPLAMYQGQTYAGPDQATRTALDMTEQRALGPNGPLSAAVGTTERFMDPSMMMAGNPYLSQAVGYASEPAQSAFADAIRDSKAGFSAAGRYGSNAHVEQNDRYADTLARNITGMAGNMAYQNYGDAAGRAMQAAQLAPQVEGAEYAGTLGRLGVVGATREGWDQQRINEEMMRHNYERTENERLLGNLGAAAGQNFGGTTTGSTMVPMSRPNPFGMAAGGAMTGMSMGGPWGAAVGGGLGLLSGLM